MTKPVIDELVFSEIQDLMGDALGSLIKTYFDNSPKLIAAIAQAIPAGDMEAVAHNAHQLKGGSGNIGAMQVFNLSMQLENDAREGQVENLAAAFFELEAAYVRVEEALKAHL